MTIHIPDVSQYTPNVDPAQYPAIIARATLSNRVADPTYAGFKAKADKAGTVFAAYHWLNHGNLAAQAKWCYQHVGPDVPVMIDAEDVAGNTGYNGPLTVDDLTGFKAEYLALGGGPVNLGYMPFWYWAGPMGAPHSLDRLTAAGIHLVSSNYPKAGYTENGPGWAPYYTGAPTPVQWQYTSTPIDMNAFRGTVADFAAMIGGNTVTPEEIQSIASAVGAEVQIQYGLWRLDAMASGSTSARGGPAGPKDANGNPQQPEEEWIVRAIIDLQTKVAALSIPAPAPVDPATLTAALLDPAFLAALAKAVNDDAAARLAH